MKNSLNVAASLVFAIGLSGCNGSAEDSASSNSAGDAVSMQKIYVDQAMLEQIAPHKKECKGSNANQKVCVEICHRPPGNPQKGKSKIMPLAAINGHGCGGNKNSHDSDYMGPCHSEDDDSGDDGSSDDSSNDNGSSDDDSSDDQQGGGDTGGGGGSTSGEIPAWCVPYVNIDANCDGVIDSNGEPYL